MRAGLQVTERPATRDRILATAERLFAERGYHAVSLRDIGGEADAQIALISYHFGSKELLYRAVFERRLTPVTERRRAGLAAAMAATQGRPGIEAVLDAFARPWIEIRDTEEGQFYARLIAREVNDPQEQERGIVESLLDPIARDFLAAMERALPHHERSEIHWAYHFFIGLLTLTMANPRRVRRLSGDLMEEQTTDAVVSRLVAFVTNGLQAGKAPEAPSQGGRTE